jgi:hypothetical protein
VTRLIMEHTYVVTSGKHVCSNYVARPKSPSRSTARLSRLLPGRLEKTTAPQTLASLPDLPYSDQCNAYKILQDHAILSLSLMSMSASDGDFRAASEEARQEASGLSSTVWANLP